MALDVKSLQTLMQAPNLDAWRTLIGKASEILAEPLTEEQAVNEVIRRDRKLGVFDHCLSTCAWDLWEVFGESVERTADRLIRWWSQPYSAKAVLILDGLSLRELPWLLAGAEQHGFVIQELAVTAAELPPETTAFAQALGFASRSQLQNNGAGQTHRLQPARTECVDLPWKDCAALIDSAPNWVFWHPWPDSRMHGEAGAGQGLEALTREVKSQLTGDDFWAFVARLATGRRLLITSDHGYAASGYFPDAEGEVSQFLKKTFASGRNAAGGGDTGPFVPPVALWLETRHGPYRLALGRWKWKSQGGYPTLTHGGLSLLEVLSPWVELSQAKFGD